MRFASLSLATLTCLLLASACSGKYVSAGGDQQSGVVQCDDYATCGQGTSCDTGECIAISGCASPVCVSSAAVCLEACGDTDCTILDSYPGQIQCADGSPIRGVGGDDPPPQVGTSGGPSYAGYPSQGGYASGGYASGGYGAGGAYSGGGAYASGGAYGGGAAGAGVVDCQAYSRCNADVPCDQFDCISLPGCQLGICAPAFPLCENLCAGDCAVLESYPVQLSCSTGPIVGVEEYGTGGTGAGGSPPGAGGDYGSAGHAFGGESASGSN